MSITKDELIKPGKTSSAEKASRTDEAARQIIQADQADRIRKTERLRLLREARDADGPAIVPPTQKKRAAKSGK